MIYRYISIINICVYTITAFFAFTTVKSTTIAIDTLEISVDTYEVTIDQYESFLTNTDYTTAYNEGGLKYDYNKDLNEWTESPALDTWESHIEQLDGNLPVTMVSYRDACAYCESKQGRLPTAEEWDAYSGPDVIKGNIWHGIFPYRDYGNDGYRNTLSPVGQMTPIANGLHDIYGNVWEYVQSEPGAVAAKGGSYLCDFSMCSDTKSKGHMLVYNEQRLQSNIGFRCVYDLIDN